jgi:hypothetical protein
VGNILSQMQTNGVIRSLEEGWEIVARSFPPRQFEPQATEAWQAAALRFVTIKSNSKNNAL